MNAACACCITVKFTFISHYTLHSRSFNKCFNVYVRAASLLFSVERRKVDKQINCHDQEPPGFRTRAISCITAHASAWAICSMTETEKRDRRTLSEEMPLANIVARSKHPSSWHYLASESFDPKMPLHRFMRINERVYRRNSYPRAQTESQRTLLQAKLPLPEHDISRILYNGALLSTQVRDIPRREIFFYQNLVAIPTWNMSFTKRELHPT